MSRRRKRLALKCMNVHVRLETYGYVSDEATADGSLGIALDKIVREHAWLTKKKDITPEKYVSKVQ